MIKSFKLGSIVVDRKRPVRKASTKSCQILMETKGDCFLLFLCASK